LIVVIAAPIFLVALIPWLGVVLWLLLGRRKRVDVPFVELWRGPVVGPTPKRRIGLPPIALAALMAAMLLAILAASRPGIASATGSNQAPIVIVVDRGLTMSMGVVPRFEVLAEEIKPVVREEFRRGDVHVVIVPGIGVIKRTVDDWINAAKSMDATAVDTRGMVEAAVRQQLLENPSSPVIALTDQPMGEIDKRVLRIAPKGEAKNVSIAHLAARISPTGQVMVRVRNRTSHKTAMLRVLSDERETARQEVELPQNGEMRDYFLPIAPGAKVIKAQIDAADDFAADNLAHLVRRQSWPLIEVRTPISAELQRLIDRYSRLRPAGEQSRRIGIGEMDAEVVMGKIGAGPGASGAVSVASHPITASLERVDWAAMAGEGTAELPAGDWQVLVRVGERAVLAVSQHPVRKVWVGLSTQKISATPEFVILWSSIFDWAGEGGEEFTARSTGQLEKGWAAVESQPANLPPGYWPGLFRRSDGAIMVVNAPDVDLPATEPSDWRARLAELAKENRQPAGVRSLATWLIIAAMGLMLIAAMTWRGGIRHGHASTPAHATQTLHSSRR
jgi:hypothetical protein